MHQYIHTHRIQLNSSKCNFLMMMYLETVILFFALWGWFLLLRTCLINLRVDDISDHSLATTFNPDRSTYRNTSNINKAVEFRLFIPIYSSPLPGPLEVCY